MYILRSDKKEHQNQKKTRKKAILIFNFPKQLRFIVFFWDVYFEKNPIFLFTKFYQKASLDHPVIFILYSIEKLFPAMSYGIELY